LIDAEAFKEKKSSFGSSVLSCCIQILRGQTLGTLMFWTGVVLSYISFFSISIQVSCCFHNNCYQTPIM